MIGDSWPGVCDALEGLENKRRVALIRNRTGCCGCPKKWAGMAGWLDGIRDPS